MIKILFVHHGKSVGGALISLVQLCNFLDKEKYDIKVLLLKGDATAFEFLRKNQVQYAVPKTKFILNRYRFFLHSEASNKNTFNFFRQFLYAFSWFAVRFYYARKELSGFNPDIIHLNSAFLTDWLKPASAKAKVITHIREPMHNGIFGLRNRFFARQMNLYADHVIAISEDNLRRVKCNLRFKSSVVYNYVNDKIHEFENVSVVTGKVLYLGGSMTIKGFYTLVDALEFLDHGITIHFSGPFEEESLNNTQKYLQAISKIKNSPNAKLIGFTENVLNEISSSEFLVSPFKKAHFSRPIIEAYSLKKPVIATQIQGIEEMVKNKITGILVENNNPVALAQAINELYKNMSLRESYGLSAREYFERNFTPKNFQKIENIYTLLIR